MGLSIAAVKRGFEESLWTLCQFRERFPPCWTERGVLRNIVVLKKGTLIFYRQVLASHQPFVFDSWLGASELFILFFFSFKCHVVRSVSEAIVKLNDVQVSCLLFPNTKSLSELEIRDLKTKGL